jgi:hypothetical protein
MDDYDSLEAVRQGVKHHFSKPGATAESAIDGILNILTKRMRKSGNYVDLNRFREALRQGVAHQLKKQGVAEGGMPASVIRAKERMAQASDEELYSKFQELSSKTGRSVRELALSMARRHGYGQDSGKYWDRISHLALDKPMDEAKTCNMSESGTMCSEHGLAECGMSEDDNSIPVDHQEQDPIEGLKSLLGRLRT